jgi:hypothetical protein
VQSWISLFFWIFTRESSASNLGIVKSLKDVSSAGTAAAAAMAGTPSAMPAAVAPPEASIVRRERRADIRVFVILDMIFPF